jgi:adenylosuccinate synthase
MSINFVDICVGLAWGDEGKGKVVSYLSKHNEYNFVCRWNGGNNAGHTIYKNGQKYKTHLIPSGVFTGVKSIIGPGCVINLDAFYKEINYLKENGFDTSLVKVSPKAHVITEKHINEDCVKNNHKSTNKGIAPCYRDKFARSGLRVDLSELKKEYIWDEKLYGNILCEGAQGFWLDIDYGNYPFVTSSSTLPYSACSLGFSPKLIRHIYGIAKIYDTRAGEDPLFPETLLDDLDLKCIGDEGEEYGTTTGRRRKVNWLNLDKLIEATNISGTTKLVISKIDILIKLNLYKYIYKHKLLCSDSIETMQQSIKQIVLSECPHLKELIFSNNKETIGLI